MLLSYDHVTSTSSLPSNPYPLLPLRPFPYLLPGDDRLQLLQPLHRIGDRETRFCHHLSTLLGDLGQRLHLAQLVGVFAQLAQDVAPLARLARRQIVVADGDDARHDRDDLRQVLV
jgi:hypothetical protein